MEKNMEDLNNNFIPLYENRDVIKNSEEESSIFNESIDNSIVKNVVNKGLDESLSINNSELNNYNEYEDLTEADLLQMLVKELLKNDENKNNIINSNIEEKNEENDELNKSKIAEDFSNLKIKDKIKNENNITNSNVEEKKEENDKLNKSIAINDISMIDIKDENKNNITNSNIEEEEKKEENDELNKSKIAEDFSNLKIKDEIKNENNITNSNVEEEKKENKKKKIPKKYRNKERKIREIKEKNKKIEKDLILKQKKMQRKTQEKAERIEGFAKIENQNKIENITLSKNNKKIIEDQYEKIIKKLKIYENKNNSLTETQIAEKNLFYESHKDIINFLKSLPTFKFYLLKSSIEEKFSSLDSKKTKKVFQYFYNNDDEFRKNFNNINLEDLNYYFNKPEHKKFKKNNKKILKEIKEISENKKEKNAEILKQLLNVQENLKNCNSTKLMELFNKVLTDYKKECEENYKDYYLEYKNSDAFISPEESLKWLLCETFSKSIVPTQLDLKYSEEFNHGNQRREKFLSIMKSSPNYSELVELSKKRLLLKMQQWVASGGKDLKNKMNYLKKSGKLLKDGGDEFFKLIFED